MDPVVQAPPVLPVAAPVRQVAAPVLPAAPPAPPVATSYVVTLDTGQAMSVFGWGYIGRHPQAAAGEQCDHVIEIDDPNRSLSRTHASASTPPGSGWRTEARSTERPSSMRTARR